MTTDHDNARRYYAYADGFRDGAGVRPYESKDHADDYSRGFKDGQLAKRAATTAFAAEVGYTVKFIGVPAPIGGAREQWRCGNCDERGEGRRPAACPFCGAT